MADEPDDLTPQERQSIHEARAVSQAEILTARWGNVRKPVRDGIENLNEQDMQAMMEMIDLVRKVGMENLRKHVQMAEAAAQMGKFAKWMVLTGAALASAIVVLMTAFRSFRESIGK